MKNDETDGNAVHTYTQVNKESNKESNVEPEPHLTANNKRKLAHFRRLGIFLVYWKKEKGKYEASEKKVLISYLMWYLVISSCFGVAYMFKEIFKRNDKNYTDRVDDLIEASFVAILVGVIPAFWIYLLREYNTYLPRILTMTSKLEKEKIYQKLKLSKDKGSTISYREGWEEDDYNDSEDEDFIDSDDEDNTKTKKDVKNPCRLVKYGPYFIFILSVSICFILIIVSLFWDISIIILQTPARSLKHLKKELPKFIMAVVYPFPYFLSIWFCIFFLEWQRKIHESVRYRIRKIKKSAATNSNRSIKLTEETEEELKNIGFMLNKVQKVFILLNKKIFQKTIVVDFTVFIFLGIFCCWKVLQDPSNFAYVMPLLLIIGHIYMVCSWSNALMKEFSETNQVLNEMHEEECKEIENFRKKLNKCPPQVMAFGGFSVNYNMMTAVLAFILSCIGIPEEMWPEDNQHCYKYDFGDGEWNTNNTLCLKNKLLIGVNKSLTLKNLED